MQVHEMMTRNPTCCTPETPLQTVAHRMVEHVCGAIPVVRSLEDPEPIGMVTDRDITCRAVAGGRNPLHLMARDVMTAPVVKLLPTATLEECIQTMEREEVRRVVVVDQDDHVCGIVSPADLARKAPEHEMAEVMKELSQPIDVPSRPAAAMPRHH